MAEQQDARREQYARARTEFDHLSVEDKALFLIEATAATLARGLEEAGRALAREVDHWFRPAADEEADADEASSDEEEAEASKKTKKPRGRSGGKKTTGGSRKKSSDASEEEADDQGT